MRTFLLCFTNLGYLKNTLLYMKLFSFSYSLIQSPLSYLIIATSLQLQPTVAQRLPLSLLQLTF